MLDVTSHKYYFKETKTLHWVFTHLHIYIYIYHFFNYLEERGGWIKVHYTVRKQSPQLLHEDWKGNLYTSIQPGDNLWPLVSFKVNLHELVSNQIKIHSSILQSQSIASIHFPPWSHANNTGHQGISVYLLLKLTNRTNMAAGSLGRGHSF